MAKVWFFDKNAGVALLIDDDTPVFQCRDEQELRRIAAEFRRRPRKGKTK